MAVTPLLGRQRLTDPGTCCVSSLAKSEIATCCDRLGLKKKKKNHGRWCPPRVAMDSWFNCVFVEACALPFRPQPAVRSQTPPLLYHFAHALPLTTPLPGTPLLVCQNYHWDSKGAVHVLLPQPG